jgi:hypothetical protein
VASVPVQVSPVRTWPFASRLIGAIQIDRREERAVYEIVPIAGDHRSVHEHVRHSGVGEALRHR